MSASPSTDAFLPTTAAEVAARGWEQPDVVFVSGDAYVDHPSFAAALLGRSLEAAGFKVAILSQPDWKSADAWRTLGPPRLFYAVSAGNMDSMINHYTANRKRRNEDAYSPGGEIERRPDRATNVYAQRCREAFRDVPVIVGGVEASLRRIAHYDWWSEKVRPSVLVSTKADLLGYGMGETTICEVAKRLDAGESAQDLRDMRGVAYLLGAKEELPPHFGGAEEARALPSYEEVQTDHVAFATMTRTLHHETNPLNARRLTQDHGGRTLVINPPELPLEERALDAAYDQPFTRRPHPSYTDTIPAWEMIRDSVTIMRGCFGGCTFCSITMHQGRAIQSRSKESILREVEATASQPDFKGSISDLGGPTANMYRMRCSEPEVERSCRRLSCVHPTVCELLGTDHGPTVELLREARAVKGVKRVHVASGIRMDLAAGEDEYLEEMAAHHVSGHLKVAPEHASEDVLRKMKKPSVESFDEFADRFLAASARAGKEQYLVPYFIASHPGSGIEEMIELALFLKARGYKPLQVQDFIPAPMDIATCMHFTGLDPIKMKPVKTVQRLSDRKVQRALMQFFLPENWFTVRRALIEAEREDLIGPGRECLIPDNPPKEALAAKRRNADASARGKGKGGEGRAGSRSRSRGRSDGSGRG